MRPARPGDRTAAALVTPCLALALALALALGFVLVLALVTPARADLSVLIRGGTREILARSGDSLSGGGGVLRPSFDKIFWFPEGNGEQGYLFVNHEVVYPGGGVSRLRYESGAITERLSWMTGTHFNSSGIISSWGTILSSEEHPPADSDTLGQLIEVDPHQPDTWVRRAALGHYSHEGLAEDPVTRDIYLADDSYYGVFFKFVPDVYGDLSSGTLYGLREATRDWVAVTDMVNTQSQAIALGATWRPRPEGVAYNPIDDAFYMTVTGRRDDPDSRLGYILRFDPRTDTMTRWLDGDGTLLANPDNIVIDSWGNLLVQEDQYPENKALYGPNELLIVRLDGSVEPLLRGTDFFGEVTGLEMGPGEATFWINWMNGASGSELVEVEPPPGWNHPVAGAGEGAGSPRPGALALAAVPNPFGPATRLTAEVERGARVRLEIFDVRGARWRTLVDRPIAGGRLDVTWDGRDAHRRAAPQGRYFARLTAGGRTSTIPLLLMR